MNRNFWKRYESVQEADERKLRLHYLAQQILRKRRMQQAAGGDEQSLPAVNFYAKSERNGYVEYFLATYRAPVHSISSGVWRYGSIGYREGFFVRLRWSGGCTPGMRGFGGEGVDVVNGLIRQGEPMEMGTVMYAGHYYEVVDYRQVSDTFLLFPIEEGDRKLWAPRDEIQVVVHEKLWHDFLKNSDATVDQVMKGEVVILKSFAAASAATGK